jgi:hypothetical protein
MRSGANEEVGAATDPVADKGTQHNAKPKGAHQRGGEN